jgi:hypothetical protein
MQRLRKLINDPNHLALSFQGDAFDSGKDRGPEAKATMTGWPMRTIGLRKRLNRNRRKSLNLAGRSSLPRALLQRIDVRADRKGSSLHVVRVRFLGIALPRLLPPTLAARASEWRGRYQFSTTVGF